MIETEPHDPQAEKRVHAAQALLKHLLITCKLEYLWFDGMVSTDKPIREYVWYKDWLSLSNEYRRADGEEELTEDVTLVDVLLLFETDQDGMEQGLYRNFFWGVIELVDGIQMTDKKTDDKK